MLSSLTKNPFSDSNGIINFPLSATRDVVFIYPQELPEEIRGITIPEKFRQFHKDSAGIVLSCGSGYYDKKGKWVATTINEGDWVLFDLAVREINWKIKVKSTIDGKEYVIVYCGEKDISGVIEL